VKMDCLTLLRHSPRRLTRINVGFIGHNLTKVTA
jgi:hypothetical protein